MKKFVLYSLIALLTLAMLGCACGSTAQSTGLENAEFSVVVEDAQTKEILQYFQAHTGYLPTVTVLDDETLAAKAAELAEDQQSAERADVLNAVLSGATCALTRSDTLTAELESLGCKVDNDALKALSASYRIDNAGTLGLTVVQMPSGSEINSDALTALAAWLTGAEAQYLEQHPDLLN